MSNDYENGQIFINSLVSNEKQIQNQAKNYLSLLESKNSKLLCKYCLEVLSYDEDEIKIQIILYILKRNFILGSSPISIEVRSQLILSLLNTMKKLKNTSILSICAEGICDLESHSANYNLFLQEVIQMYNDKEKKLKYISLIIIECFIAKYLNGEILSIYSSDFEAILTNAILGTDLEIKLSAFKAFARFILVGLKIGKSRKTMIKLTNE